MIVAFIVLVVWCAASVLGALAWHRSIEAVKGHKDGYGQKENQWN